MTKYCRCNHCEGQPVTVRPNDMDIKCSACGKICEVITPEHFKQAFDAGAIYNIDPRTGGPAKKKKR